MPWILLIIRQVEFTSKAGVFLSVSLEMVCRFEMASLSGKRGLLQYMVPWLQNVELVDFQPQVVIMHLNNSMQEEVGGAQASGNPVLPGTGWGSTEGTRVVLQNLLFITTKVGGVSSLVETIDLLCKNEEDVVTVCPTTSEYNRTSRGLGTHD